MNSKKCFTCHGNHNSRDCPIEQQLSGQLKKLIGIKMERIIGNSVCCPKCKKHTLTVLGNNSPSLDIVCSTCHKKIECKSKCLSINQLPQDIVLNHGSYKSYIKRQNDGLDFIIIIYGIDRKSKTIKIRKVLYANNSYIKTNNNFIVKQNKSSHSTIYINNHLHLQNLPFNGPKIISYKSTFDRLVKGLRKN